MIKTKWIILAGTASCGKTSVLEVLEKRGYRCVKESARAYFTAELAKGFTIEQLCAKMVPLQKKILALQESFLEGVPFDEVAFLDRIAHVEGVAYIRSTGEVPPPEILEAARKHQHAQVFLLEPLPFEKDAVRIEDEDRAMRVHREIEKAYRELGYEIIDVPLFPVPGDIKKSIEKRADFILERVKNAALIPA